VTATGADVDVDIEDRALGRENCHLVLAAPLIGITDPGGGVAVLDDVALLDGVGRQAAQDIGDIRRIELLEVTSQVWEPRGVDPDAILHRAGSKPWLANRTWVEAPSASVVRRLKQLGELLLHEMRGVSQGARKSSFRVLPEQDFRRPSERSLES